ncbi:MAG: glycosyltransferase family 2 protein [Acidobacteriota bacterium]|jgi:dolichyl-phosphate beta-glucosyltransferase
MVESSKTKLSVIIPAFNEEMRLPRTLAQVSSYLNEQTYLSEVVVVNDGSTDNTEGVVRNQDFGSVSLKLLNHPDGLNHGKGASVRQGMLAACGQYRLFMDADNSTTLDQIERFWPIFDDGFDVVVGSRALKKSVIKRHQSFLKELAGRTGNIFVRVLAIPGIQDTQAGFKMFTSDAAEKIFPKQTIDGWGFDIEILAIAHSMGYRMREVPITWINALGSKVKMGSYIEVLGEIWRIRRNLRSGLYK